MNPNPIVYDKGTPDEIRTLLYHLVHTDKRVRLFYGDTEKEDFEKVHGHKPDPGLDWNEENDVTGTIGKSTGEKPCLLLINNSRSMGGGAILTGCIVRMLVNGHEVYRHPKYHNKLYWGDILPADLPEYTHMVVVDGEPYARFHSKKAAERWFAFMLGERMGK